MKGFLLVCLLVGYAAAQWRHPYVDKRSEEIDSDEHGVTPGRKATSCKCGWANRVTSRIVGGQETEVNQFPFAVGIMPRNRHFIFCGGTIISEYHVVTASHCTAGETASKLDVIVGEHSVLTWSETDATKVHNVAVLTQHPQYDPTHETNDIAILTLATKINFSNKVGPACLPHSRNQYNLVDKYIKVMGWGDIMTGGSQSKWLRHTNLRVIPLDICKRSFRAFISLTDPTQICTFSKRRDACQGDSGGPIVYLDPETNRYSLVGVVSYGAECATTTPGVNTEVAAYLDWIQSTMTRTNPAARSCRRL